MARLMTFFFLFFFGVHLFRRIHFLFVHMRDTLLSTSAPRRRGISDFSCTCGTQGQILGPLGPTTCTLPNELTGPNDLSNPEISHLYKWMIVKGNKTYSFSDTVYHFKYTEHVFIISNTKTGWYCGNCTFTLIRDDVRTLLPGGINFFFYSSIIINITQKIHTCIL